MKTSAFCCALLTLIIVSLHGSSVLAQGAEEGLGNIVFALDISASMQADGNFAKVRDRLIEFIEDEVELQTNVVVVAFGENASLVVKQLIKTQADKATLVAHIKQMKAEAKATYMVAGIDLALQELQTLHRQHPERNGMLVMLTDGKNQPPDSVPAEKRITFAQLRQRYTGIADFQPGNDWFFWYCFIGNPDNKVREFVESMSGESKPVTGPWKFLKVRFNRAVLRLPDMSPGNWRIEYPTAGDRALGELLTVTTRSPGQYDLQISNVILENAGPGERITVAPRNIRMDRAEQSIVLQLTAKNIISGKRRGRIIFRAPGKMVFVQPQQFHVTFRAVAATVAVAPRDGLQFGRILPGTSMEKTIELLPNEAAGRLAVGKSVQVLLPKDIPSGLRLSAEPTAVRLDSASIVRLKLSMSTDAKLPPEGYRGVLAFSEIPGLSFTPETLPVSVEASRPEVDVTPPGELDFGTLAPGGKAVREVFLTPNEAARAVGATISPAAEGVLPDGVTLEIEPREAIVTAKTVVQLTLALKRDAGAVGDLQGRIVLSVDKASVVISSQKLTWQAKIARVVVYVAPDDRIDFGVLEPSQQRTQSLFLVPNDAAAALKPIVRLTAEDLPPDASITFAPQQVALERRHEIKVTLTAGSSPDRQEVKLKLTCDSADVQLGVSELAATYAVEVSGITIDADKLLYGNLLPGDTTMSVPVRVVASQGAVGETVRLDWSFAELPEDMSVVPTLEQVTLSQKVETVALPLVLKGAVPGEYVGSVKFRATSPVRPKELPVRISVMERLVQVVDPPQPWSIGLSAFWPRARVEQPVVLRANRAADGATITLQPAEPTPNGIQIEAEPVRLILTVGDNAATLTTTVTVFPSFFGRTYRQDVNLIADEEDVAVRPNTITWEVVVPPLWPYVVGLLLIAQVLRRFYGRRRVLKGKERIGSIEVIKVPAGVTVRFQGAESAEGDHLRIGILRKKDVFIGSASPKEKAGVDVLIEGDPAVRPQHARIHNRGGVHRIKALYALDIVAPRKRHLGRGKRDRLYDQDEIRIGQVLLKFRNPGAKRRT